MIIQHLKHIFIFGILRLFTFPELRKKLFPQLLSLYFEEFLPLLTSAYFPKLFSAFTEAMRGSSEKTALFHSLLQSALKDKQLVACFETANYGTFCHGQEGEDILLKQLLCNQTSKFFVDVGAHHPIRFSNTYSLYQSGWRGVNIDATPGSMRLFQELRPEDINIEAVISDLHEPLCFYIFEEGALNTSDVKLAQEYIASGWPLQKTVVLKPQRLSAVLDRSVPCGMEIGMMSIDVEGHELHVLQSNDWEKYRPHIIVLELLDTPLCKLEEHPVSLFLHTQGYTPSSLLRRAAFFTREN